VHGRQFLGLLAASLVFRAWLGVAFPITGDEAYFVGWGRHPDWGYYDHPPMVGWWLAALLPVGDAAGWLRLPAILQPALLALAVRWALPRLWPAVDPERRDWIALLVLLAPVNVWNVFITTDTPLVYFGVMSGLAWLRAAQERPGDGLRWYLLSGALLAGAVLSKYFVAFLGFAYLVDVLRRRSARSVVGLAAAYACTLPALALMAWWNADNCWPNLMFNFINRHDSAGGSWQTPLLYLATLIYVLGPPAAWFAVRNRRTAGAEFAGPAFGTLSLLAWLPFALFALLSLVKQIGLHWLLGFVPFALAWLGLRLPLPTLRRLGVLFAGIAGLHIAAVLIASRVPLEAWQKTRLYDGIVQAFEHRAIGEALAPHRDGRILAMESYSSAATLAYNLRWPVVVFGPGGVHARQDDLDTDFRAFAGRDMLILRKSAPSVDDYAPYFKAVRVDSFAIRGARFWVVFGDGFDFAVYRERVLQPVKARYYRLPDWLPQRGCPLCDRYFPEEACRR
jgi:hypothetical protein